MTCVGCKTGYFPFKTSGHGVCINKVNVKFMTGLTADSDVNENTLVMKETGESLECASGFAVDDNDACVTQSTCTNGVQTMKPYTHAVTLNAQTTNFQQFQTNVCNQVVDANVQYTAPDFTEAAMPQKIISCKEEDSSQNKVYAVQKLYNSGDPVLDESSYSVGNSVNNRTYF